MGEKQKKKSSLIFPKNIFLLLKNDLRNFGLCFQLFTVIFEIFRAILGQYEKISAVLIDANHSTLFFRLFMNSGVTHDIN
jgi:hypothetical protein